MNIFMIIWLVIGVPAAFIFGVSWAYDRSVYGPGDEDTILSARFTLVSLVWPIALVVAIPVGIVYLIGDAFGTTKRSNS